MSSQVLSQWASRPLFAFRRQALSREIMSGKQGRGGGGGGRGAGKRCLSALTTSGNKEKVDNKVKKVAGGC